MTYASDQAMKDIGGLLSVVHRSGEWRIEHDDLLQRWRDARGPEGLGGWTWWAKTLDSDVYTAEGPTKADAVADLLNDHPDAQAVQVCEARCYDDEIAVVDETVWFAETRKMELLPAAQALALARTSARYRPRRREGR